MTITYLEIHTSCVDSITSASVQFDFSLFSEFMITDTKWMDLHRYTGNCGFKHKNELKREKLLGKKREIIKALNDFFLS